MIRLNQKITFKKIWFLEVPLTHLLLSEIVSDLKNFAD